MVRASTERLFFLIIIVFLLASRQISLHYILEERSTDLSQWTDRSPFASIVSGPSWRNPNVNYAVAEKLDKSKNINSLRTSVCQIMDSVYVYSDRLSKPTIISNIIRRSVAIDRVDITLTVHLNVHKFHILLTMLKYWSGPASVAVYLTSSEDVHAFFEFVDSMQDYLLKASFHLVLEKRPDTKWPYAHNILRNVALDMVESDYFAAFDVDFIPSPRLHEHLVHLLRSNTTTFRQHLRRKTLFVVPAFEMYPRRNETHATEDMMPKSAAEVVAMVHNDTLTPFRKSFPVSHNLTNFPKWINAVENDMDSSFWYPISMEKAKDKERRTFEPYVVGYRRGLPRYWEELRGYGYNKRSFFQECRIAGYNFAALNNVYCVHLDHPEVTNEDRTFYEDLNEAHYKEFVLYMVDKYNMTRNAIKKLVGKWKVGSILPKGY